MHRIAYWLKSFVASFYWLVTQGHFGVRSLFNALYGGQARSESFRKIYREVFGDDWAAEADPSGFSTMTDMRNIARLLDVGPGRVFADLACGRGGGGMWIARETGAKIVGLDISDVAIDDARRRIGEFGLAGRAEFVAGDIASTGFPTAGFDAAMSIDSLFLVPDKTGALREAARIVKPGGRFVFTTWEVNLSGMIKEYRTPLADVGFDVEYYEETPDWERRQRGVYERILAEQETLKREMGPQAAKVWILDAQKELQMLPHMRRILVAARRR